MGSNPAWVTYGGLAQLGEHLPYKQRVTGSSPVSSIWPVGQVVKTPPFHGGNMGSIPVRVTIVNKSELFPDWGRVRIYYFYVATQIVRKI